MRVVDLLIRAAASAMMVLAICWLVMLLAASGMGWGGRNGYQIALFVLFGLLLPVALTCLCAGKGFSRVRTRQREEAVAWVIASMLPIPALYGLFYAGIVF
jgi:hypothetical protein